MACSVKQCYSEELVEECSSGVMPWGVFSVVAQAYFEGFSEKCLEEAPCLPRSSP